MKTNQTLIFLERSIQPLRELTHRAHRASHRALNVGCCLLFFPGIFRLAGTQWPPFHLVTNAMYGRHIKETCVAHGVPKPTTDRFVRFAFRIATMWGAQSHKAAVSPISRFAPLPHGVPTSMSHGRWTHSGDLQGRRGAEEKHKGKI